MNLSHMFLGMAPLLLLFYAVILFATDYPLSEFNSGAIVGAVVLFFGMAVIFRGEHIETPYEFDKRFATENKEFLDCINAEVCK